ncbi:MAG: hypothetical protein PWQ09_411 [Candidatus Cloacimonadota bacterium]|nr:hypothetical protein [Candidatus Cloacimonadota bacterium]
MKWTKELFTDLRIMIIVLVTVVISLSTYSIMNWIFIKINEPDNRIRIDKFEESYESPRTNFPPEEPKEDKGSVGRIKTKQNIGRWVHPAIVIIISVIVVVLFLGVLVVAFVSRFL